MRLALITHKFVKGDGQGRVNYELARAALAAGHTVFLLASEVAPELGNHPLARVVRIGVAGVPTALLQNQLFACKTALWIWRRRGELDLVHANGFVGWCAADLSSSHFVHAAWIASRYHTWRVRRDGYGLYQFLYSLAGKHLERWSYQHARCVVAVSEQVRRELLETGVSPARLRVIPNGVDTEEFAPREVSREAVGLPQGKLVLFIGDIKTPRKNLDTLLRAMVDVRDATLAVAGDPTGSPYPRLAARLGLGGRVSFLGFHRDVARLMAAADIFVFPSRYEACSLVLLEAAASGLPIVSASTVGGTELLTPECSVLLQDPEDHVELAATLNRLLASPALLRRMGLEARRVALANSWQVMAQSYLQLYLELMQQPARQTHDVASSRVNV
jgi:glycosyltransferase involved in cell wall biosynthesis